MLSNFLKSQSLNFLFLARPRNRRLKNIKIRSERGNIAISLTEENSIIRDYCEHFYTKKLDNPGETDRFLKRHKLSVLSRKGRSE